MQSAVLISSKDELVQHKMSKLIYNVFIFFYHFYKWGTLKRKYTRTFKHNTI